MYLQQLGLDFVASQAVPIAAVRIAGRDKVTERALPFAAMSLTRRCLDGHLLALAEQAGVAVHRGCSVETLDHTSAGWCAHVVGGQQVLGSDVFLATGKHDLRGFPRTAGMQPGLVAFKMYWRLQLAEQQALGRAVELVTYRGGYAGLQPVEGGRANLCCLVQSNVLRQLGKGWSGLLAHMRKESAHLRRRLTGAEPLLDKPLTMASIPYGFVRQRSDGIWYLGDQAAVIPSFTGDGMSLALHTGMQAAQYYLQRWSADTYQQALAAQVGRQVSVATAVSKLLVRVPRASLFIPAVWPGAIDLIARQTRINPRCLVPERS